MVDNTHPRVVGNTSRLAADPGSHNRAAERRTRTAAVGGRGSHRAAAAVAGDIQLVVVVDRVCCSGRNRSRVREMELVEEGHSRAVREQEQGMLVEDWSVREGRSCTVSGCQNSVFWRGG